MVAKLKVFQTVIGLRTWVVAASSQKAAMKAWDIQRDLFANGEAAETKDPAAIMAALDVPGIPVALKGVPSGVLEQAIKAAKPGHGATRAAAKPAKPIKKDRTRLDAAEKELASFKKQAASRRQKIEDERMDAEVAWAAELKRLKHQEDALVARLAREKAAYEG